MSSKTVDMCEGKLLPNILRFTFPVILSGILQLLFNAADLVVVGQFGSEYSVAAVGSTSSIISLLVNLFICLSTGAGVSVAISLGAGDNKSVYRLVHTAIPTAVIGGAIVTAISIPLSRVMLELMGSPAEIIDLSATYLVIYFCGMIPSMVYNFGAAILRASGNTKGPLFYLAAAGVLNVILNVIFVAVFNMDVAGVALATAISQTLSAFLVVIALIKTNNPCQLYLREMRIYLPELKKIISIGLPAGIQSSMFNIANVVIQSAINSLGAAAVAGSSASSSIEGFVYISMNSFLQTSINFVGQNLGAHNFKRIKSIMITCIALVTVVGLALGFGVVAGGHLLLSFYLGNEPEQIAYGYEKLAMICSWYFLCGLMDTTTGGLRGMGSSKTPMFICMIGACLSRLVWIFTAFRLPQFHSISGLFISYPISWSLTFIAELLAFIIIFRKKQREYDKERRFSGELN